MIVRPIVFIPNRFVRKLISSPNGSCNDEKISLGILGFVSLVSLVPLVSLAPLTFRESLEENLISIGSVSLYSTGPL